ncbi:succinate-semialdehyde dehydrogenase [Agreia sp. Leaf244]|uniref:aldehyde dehydrogenase family protein n=1 Tax=Agreia sp. Leaf244 TaxID=1736305 RepID=UPI00070188F1|nr:aldehyde dehydrogenase family protein [Agreia sp. Leaf244]KQO05409.1 succinate-semialdehyde dehydrogenase [Agreia sp. Leaf244]
MSIATINPTTGITLEIFEPHGDVEVERRLDLAAQGSAAMRASSMEQRAIWLLSTAEVLEQDVDWLASAITIEMGKPIHQSQREIQKCIHTLRFFATNAADFLADARQGDPSSVGASKAWTTWQPLGTVLAVMPWNFPLWQVIRFAVPALAAGNSCLLKHASNVPRAALYLDSLFKRGGFPDGAFQTLLIGSSAIADLIGDDRIAAVSITGSEPAGRSVATAAGKNLKKSVLELGGSDPFIVMPDADIDAASTSAVKARVQNNGQSCIAAKRFIVHSAIYDDFVDAFVSKMEALTVGDPLDEATDVGPLATQSGRDDLLDLVHDAAAGGASILTGGTAPNRPGWFFPPTVIADLHDGMRIVKEEAFGPVATLYRVNSREEALSVANGTRFGLSSSIWTSNHDDQTWFVNQLDAGAVFVNGMTSSFAELPFGGVKSSGHGRESSNAGIREFCNLKTVWVA